MELWFAALLGVVEGITEFLPISSTAHLRVVPTLLGRADPGPQFSAVIQVGALLAVLIYYANDLFVRLPRAVVREPRSPEGLLPWKIGVATIPIVVVGVVFQHAIETSWRSIYVVAASLVVVGLLLIVADRRREGTKTAEDLTWRAAFLVGVAQACALVPGVSRSGATICACLLAGTSRTQAARFSFLLGIPAIAGAGVFELRDAVDVLGKDAVPALVVGTIVSAVVAYASIAWLLRFLASHRLAPFGTYRIVVGVALVGLVLTNVVDPFQ